MVSKDKRTIRIIGGRWRSRKVAFTNDGAIRPTPDRVRETLFNWLQPHIHGARCLELYAGSGILSIEALSRGAEHVIIVDQSSSTTHAIRNSLQSLDASTTRYQCIQADAGVWIEQQSQVAWDIIFLDPPFAGDELAAVLPLISNRQLLKTGGLIYIESPGELSRSDLPTEWEILRNKQASNVHYCLCRQTNC